MTGCDNSSQGQRFLITFEVLTIVNRGQDGIEVPSHCHPVWKSGLSSPPGGAALWSIQRMIYDPVQPGHTGPAGRIRDALRDLGWGQLTGRKPPGPQDSEHLLRLCLSFVK